MDESLIYAKGLHYQDLVGACEVVVTKPGYGIISECIANETAMLYTSRGHFLEYDVLVREMPRFVRCAFIDQESLLAGRWLEQPECVACFAATTRAAADGRRRGRRRHDRGRRVEVRRLTRIHTEDAGRRPAGVRSRPLYSTSDGARTRCP